MDLALAGETLGRRGPAYLAAAGVVALLYDHLLSIDDEVQYVWKAKWTAPKFFFLLIRYAVLCGIIFHTYHLSGISDSALSIGFCKSWFNIAALLCLITAGPGNFLVMLWLWLLGERKRCLMFATLGLFALAQIASIGIAIAIMVVGTSRLTLYDGKPPCSLRERGFIQVIYVPGFIFESIALMTVFWNALARPRRRQSELFKALYNDGVSYVFIIFLIQTTNVTLTIVSPLNTLFYGLCFMWCASTITVTKLVINLRKSATQRRADQEANTLLTCVTRTISDE